MNVIDAPRTSAFIILLGLLAGLFGACGEQAVQFSDQNRALSDQSGRVDPGLAGAEADGLGAGDGGIGFLLTERASQIMARVDGCASSFSRTYEFGKQSIRLYKGDRACKGQILQFALAGELYSLPPGGVFDTTPGGMTTFISGRGERASLQLIKQLPEVINHEHETFQVNVMQLEKSADTTLVIDQDIFTLSADVNQIHEGQDLEFWITVKRVTRKNARKTITVPVSFQGDAKRGDDYLPDSDQLRFRYNEHEKKLRVRIVDDGQEEADKVIAMSLKSSSSYSSYGQLFVSLHDNDSLPRRQDVALWLSTASGVGDGSSGERVSLWRDQSGHNVHALQPVSTWQPRLERRVFGDLPGFDFSEGDQFFFLPTHPLLGSAGPYEAKTMAVVLATGKDVRTSQMLFEQGSVYAGLNLYIEGERLYFCIWNLDRLDIAPPGAVSCLSSPVKKQRGYVVTASFNALTQTLSIDGSELSKANTFGALPSLIGTTSLGNLILHSQSQHGMLWPRLPFAGQLGAFVLYNQSLSPVERSNLNTYLSSQFDL